MKIGTPFGRALRKLRIERGETLAIVAESVGVTAAFMSAIETGKKNLPQELFQKIARHFQLNKEQTLELQDLAQQSVTEVRIGMQGRDDNIRDFVAVFARTFDTLTPDDRKKVMKLLTKGG